MKVQREILVTAQFVYKAFQIKFLDYVHTMHIEYRIPSTLLKKK